MHVVKYTTIDELLDNDPDLATDVAPGSVKEGVVSIKLHIWHLFVSDLKFCGGIVDFAVDQIAFNGNRSLVCNNSWSFKTFSC